MARETKKRLLYQKFRSRKNIVVGSNDTVWVKKEKEDFDNTMGAYDGAEVAETVGLYLLYRLEDILPKEWWRVVDQ